MHPRIKGQVLGLESSPGDLFRDSPSEKSGDEEIVCENDNETGIGGDEVETEDRRKIPDPQLPHPEVVAAHNIDHTPYRSWCRWCVEGRGGAEQHRPRHRQHDIPVIGIDYFYLLHQYKGCSFPLSIYESMTINVQELVIRYEVMRIGIKL